MTARMPKVHRRHGHGYVYLQVEITQRQRLWLEEIDRECRIGLGGHVRVALSQYRARLEQQKIELAKRLQKAFSMRRPPA